MLRHPILIREERYLAGCFHSNDGLCKMKVFIPNGGYIRGEKIPIIIECVNSSSIDIRKIKVKLIQKIEAICTEPSRKTNPTVPKTIAETRAEGVNRGMSKTQEVLLQIPACCLSSNESFCKIITVKYFIFIHGKTKWYHEGFSFHFPFKIL